VVTNTAALVDVQPDGSGISPGGRSARGERSPSGPASDAVARAGSSQELGSRALAVTRGAVGADDDQVSREHDRTDRRWTRSHAPSLDPHLPYVACIWPHAVLSSTLPTSARLATPWRVRGVSPSERDPVPGRTGGTRQGVPPVHPNSPSRRSSCDLPRAEPLSRSRWRDDDHAGDRVTVSAESNGRTRTPPASARIPRHLAQLATVAPHEGQGGGRQDADDHAALPQQANGTSSSILTRHRLAPSLPGSICSRAPVLPNRSSVHRSRRPSSGRRWQLPPKPVPWRKGLVCPRSKPEPRRIPPFIP
jgi:hypothetical protein